MTIRLSLPRRLGRLTLAGLAALSIAGSTLAENLLIIATPLHRHIAAAKAAAGGGKAAQIGAASTAGMLSEAGSSAMQTREGVYQQVAAIPLTKLSASPRYQEILAGTKDPVQAREVLASDEYAQATRQREQEFLDAGIHSVPAIILNRQHLISGGQPVEAKVATEGVNGKAVETYEDVYRNGKLHSSKLVDTEVTNNSDKPSTVSSMMCFELQDSANKSYNITFTDSSTSSVDGELAPGAAKRGELAYEVPEAATGLRLQFKCDLFSSGSATINLS